MRISIQDNITILVLTLKRCDFEGKVINIFQIISCNAASWTPCFTHFWTLWNRGCV